MFDFEYPQSPGNSPHSPRKAFADEQGESSSSVPGQSPVTEEEHVTEDEDEDEQGDLSSEPPKKDNN